MPQILNDSGHVYRCDLCLVVYYHRHGRRLRIVGMYLRQCRSSVTSHSDRLLLWEPDSALQDPHRRALVQQHGRGSQSIGNILGRETLVFSSGRTLNWRRRHARPQVKLKTRVSRRCHHPLYRHYRRGSTRLEDSTCCNIRACLPSVYGVYHRGGEKEEEKRTRRSDSNIRYSKL